ncbi:MAG TPA: hypothetical protein VHP14_17540 [Anaerolineales bacterium]|nr:hypothetical protein [Anaerolineales bacterium]
MEDTLQSPLQSIRNKMGMIEAIELAIIGFVLWCLVLVITIGQPDTTFTNLFIMFIVLEGGLLGSWLIYNLYIRIARAGGRIIDILLWIVAASATASYTFWAWTILDANRWLMKKLIYRGDAPVEYAWSVRSKQIRKAWEQMRKAAANATPAPIA